MSSRTPSVPPATDPAVRPGGQTRQLLALLVTLAVLLTGCGGTTQAAPVPSVPSASAQGGGTAPLGARSARVEEQRILDQRAQAVRDRDLGAFLARVDPSNQQLVARQRRYFRNLVQLPLETLRWRALPQQWTEVERAQDWGADVSIPRVELSLQLRDFDSRPVQSIVGLVFAFDGGRARIVSDVTEDGNRLAEGPPAPWDLTPITVRQEAGVLGIFDRRTRGSAPVVMTAVRDGVAQLDRGLPFTWADRVVVYNAGDPAVLASFTDVPGGAIDHLGAMTFPVVADAENHVASTRMLLLPSSVAAGQPFLGRITRHELSHVAVGSRDDGDPAWVSEGLAEYLGARDLPQDQRIIPTDALRRARDAARGMPASERFNGSDQGWHYALSWMACDWIAENRGESVLWELVRQLHAGGQGTPDDQQDAVLERVVGLDGRGLAERAAARIRAIYG